MCSLFSGRVFLFISEMQKMGTLVSISISCYTHHMLYRANCHHVRCIRMFVSSPVCVEGAMLNSLYMICLGLMNVLTLVRCSPGDGAF